MSLITSLRKFWARKEPTAHYPGLQGHQTLYVVGDIHGRLDCLTQAHALIDHDRHDKAAADVSEIYLGDYVDRGPDSYGVIDCLLARGDEVETVFLRGNHETMFEGFLEDKVRFEAWRAVGGAETLVSYGVDGRTMSANYRLSRELAASLVPDRHRAFLKALRNYHTVGPYCFVHAGLRPDIALARQSVEDLTRIRGAFLGHAGSFSHIVVHGHTPVPEVDFRPNRINIDTGAYVTNRLSVLRIDAAGPRLLDDVERQENTQDGLDQSFR